MSSPLRSDSPDPRPSLGVITMTLAFPLARRLVPAIAALAAAMLVASCGQQQQGGFHGFPPAAVTTLVVQPKSLPITYEYVGQTVGSKEVEVRARVGGI